jgi:hypothetical protein
LPEDVWREALLEGNPEPWANPMATLHLLVWTPREDDLRSLDVATRLAMYPTMAASERCSSEGKALIAAKLQAWWAISEESEYMLQFLGWWADAKGEESTEHREVVRLLVLCVRTTPHLTDEDRQALDLLEAWSKGGEDRREIAKALAFSEPVVDACYFALNLGADLWDVIRDVMETVFDQKEKGYEKAEAEHSRLLADLIRREMTLPFVVE